MGLIKELRRRNVFRVAAAYAVTGWLVAQIADLALDAFGAPDWIIQAVLVVLVLGLPVALLFAWAYELTPEGLKRESDVDRTNSIVGQTGQRLNRLVITLLILACGVLLVDKLYLQKERDRVSTDVTIAVLPFENRSAVKEDAYFVEGIHDDLLTRLSRVGAWRIISRTSVEQIPELNLSIPEIAERLGATHVIEGSVQRSSDAVRVIVQLIDARTDAHIWAPDPYDRELTAENLFAIQSDIATSVAHSLRTVLTANDRNYVSHIGTQSLEAYDNYLRGRELLRQRTQETVDRSLEHFQKAVDIDPDFAAAWAGLGDAYRFQAWFSGASEDEALRQAEIAGRRSTQIDPHSGEAWAGLAATLRTRGELAAAEEAFLRAIDLNPNYSEGRLWFAILYEEVGKLQAAADQLERALHLDPLHPVARTNLALTKFFLGQTTEANELIKAQILQFPNKSWGYYVAANIEVSFNSDYSRAITLAEQALSIDNEAPAEVLLASIYYDLLDAETSEHWLAQFPESSPYQGLFETFLANTSLRAGDYNSAFAHAMAAYDNPHEWWYSDALRALRDVDIHFERPQSALERYAAAYPELAHNSRVSPSLRQISVAADYASLLRILEKPVEARSVAAQIISRTEYLDEKLYWFGLVRASAYMAMDDPESALDELSNIIDQGWRESWWYTFDVDPTFEPLRKDPRFIALREYVDADMRSQAEQIRRRSQ